VVDLASPEGWDVLTNAGDETPLVAIEPPHEGFRANVVVTRNPVGGLTFRDWQNGTDEMLPTVLDDYLLIDLEELAVAGHPGGRRLAHYAGPDGAALVMEQWFALVDGTGWTLTATTDALRYSTMADEFAAVAASLNLEGGA
jgi:hypothetical protein